MADPTRLPTLPASAATPRPTSDANVGPRATTAVAASSRPPTRTRRTQRDRSEATNGELVEAARTLFARDGYAATSLDAVCELAGVSKGAIYHHFRNKRELFAAVYLREQVDLARATNAAFRSVTDPWTGLRLACRRYIEVSLDPGIQRIVLLDGPSALEWDDTAASRGLWTERIRVVVSVSSIAEHLRSGEAEAMANLLFGAVCEAARAVAHDPDPPAALARALGALDVMFEALGR